MKNSAMGDNQSDCLPTLQSRLERVRPVWGTTVNPKSALAQFVVLTQRYPSQVELNDFLYRFLERPAVDAVADDAFFNDHILPAFDPQWDFELMEPQRLYFDVTHTLFYPHNSGIQRVVRRLSEQLLKTNALAVRWTDLGYPVRIEPHYLPLIEDWDNHQDVLVEEDGKPPQPIAGRFFHLTALNILRLPYILARQLVLTVETFALVLWTHFLGATNFGKRQLEAWATFKDHRSLRRRLNEKAGQKPAALLTPTNTAVKAPALILGNGSLLIPELLLGDARAEYYEALGAADNLQLGMILYDLIPLIRPEYASDDVRIKFLAYLKLLRSVTKISCISRSVENDLRHLMAIIPRTNPLPVDICTQPLAADFVGGNDAKQDGNSVKPLGTVPLVLAVGTIDPRKNGLSILRAAVQLWEQGQNFRMVFVGNLGWLNQTFMREFAVAKKTGHPVELHTKAADSVLLQLYRDCAFTVFCSVIEGFGLPVVESLYFGKPVITSNVGSMKELADTYGGCVLVSPLAIGAIRDAMKALLLNEHGLYQKLSDDIQKIKIKDWSTYAGEVSRYFSPSDPLNL